MSESCQTTGSTEVRYENSDFTWFTVWLTVICDHTLNMNYHNGVIGSNIAAHWQGQCMCGFTPGNPNPSNRHQYVYIFQPCNGILTSPACLLESHEQYRSTVNGQMDVLRSALLLNSSNSWRRCFKCVIMQWRALHLLGQQLSHTPSGAPV